jgi:branched-subunit amino acid ABC-type transport system permease component
MQHFVDGLISVSAMVPVALGFFIIYRTCGVLHFAHGALIPVGAYAFCFFHVWLAVPATMSAIAAVGVGWLTSDAIDLSVYTSLRRLRTTELGLFIASLGVYSILINMLALCFGNGTRAVALWPVVEGWPVLGARVSTARLLTLGVGFCTAVTLWIFMNRTDRGKQMRAVANDPKLACILGVSVSSVRLFAMGLGGALAALSGMLMAVDVGLWPTMGITPLFMGVVAVLIGGSTVWGVTCGALIVGTAQQVAVLWLPTRWQDAVVFLLLIVLLMVRSHRVSVNLVAAAVE